MLEQVRQDPGESAQARSSWAHLVQVSLEVLRQCRDQKAQA